MEYDSRHQAEIKKNNEMEINFKYSNRFLVDFNPFLVSFLNVLLFAVSICCGQTRRISIYSVLYEFIF